MDDSNKTGENQEMNEPNERAHDIIEEMTIPNKFGGWLILIGAGLMLFPIILSFVYIPLYIANITNPLWDILTTPGTDSYNPHLKLLLIIEASYMASLVLLSIYSIILYFRKKRLFTKLFISVVAMFTVYPIINILLSKIFPVKTAGFELGKFMISAVIGIVLIVYMVYSARVRNTFVYSLKSNSLD